MFRVPRVTLVGRRYVEFEEFFRNKSTTVFYSIPPSSSDFQSCFWRLAI